MFTGVLQVVLVLGFVTACESDVCSQKICQCTKVGRTHALVKVTCRGLGFMATGIQSDTIEL